MTSLRGPLFPIFLNVSSPRMEKKSSLKGELTFSVQRKATVIRKYRKLNMSHILRSPVFVKLICFLVYDKFIFI